LKSWAYATSPAPYGLGMSTPESWGYTPREFSAREKIHRAYLIGQRSLWAKQLEVTSNAPHYHRSDKTPYFAEDFYDTEAAAKMRDAHSQQIAKNKASEFAAKVEQARLSAAIAKGGDELDDLPDWAKGPYKGSLMNGR